MRACPQVRHFTRRINPGALSAMAELFLMNGDMCAWLYTGSPAMHSEKITLFEPELSRLKKAGAGGYSNSFIAIRRWVESDSGGGRALQLAVGALCAGRCSKNPASISNRLFSPTDSSDRPTPTNAGATTT